MPILHVISSLRYIFYNYLVDPNEISLINIQSKKDMIGELYSIRAGISYLDEMTEEYNAKKLSLVSAVLSLLIEILAVIGMVILIAICVMSILIARDISRTQNNDNAYQGNVNQNAGHLNHVNQNTGYQNNADQSTGKPNSAFPISARSVAANASRMPYSVQSAGTSFEH